MHTALSNAVPVTPQSYCKRSTEISRSNVGEFACRWKLQATKFSGVTQPLLETASSKVKYGVANMRNNYRLKLLPQFMKCPGTITPVCGDSTHRLSLAVWPGD